MWPSSLLSHAGAPAVLISAILAATVPQLGEAQAMVPRQPSSPATLRTLDASARAELLETREQVWRAWFAYDSVQLERLLPADGFLAVGADSVWRTREQTFAESRAFVKSGGRLVSIEFPRTEMQVFGDVVVIYTTFRFTTEHGGQRNTSAGNAVEVFERRGGVWQNPSWYLDFLPNG